MDINIKHIDNLTIEEQKQLKALVEKANQEPLVWKPDLCERYYYFSDHPCFPDGVSYCKWEGDKIDQYRYDLGDCFKTKEEVEFAQERQRIITELERLSKADGFDYRTATSGVYLSCMRYTQPSGKTKYTDLSSKTIYKINYCRYWDTRFATIGFSDEFAARKAVEKIGEERILKYYFGITN